MSQAIRQWVMGRRWARRALWSLGGLLAFWLLAWLLVPPLARVQIERHASDALGRKVTVARVEFSPWSLEATVYGLEVASVDGSMPQFKLARLYIDAELQSLVRWAPVIDTFELDEPQLIVAQTSPGHLDVDDVVARLAGKPGETKVGAGLPRFAVYNISIRDGALSLNDRSVGTVHRLQHLRLDIPFLSNLASDRQVRVTPALAFELNGSTFETVAQATPFANGHNVQAQLQIRRLNLATYAAYVAGISPVRLLAGELNADLQFEFSQVSKPELHIRGALTLDGAQVADAARAHLLDLARLHVVLKDVQPLRRSVELASLDMHAPQVWLRRRADGTLPISGGELGGASVAAPPEQLPWSVELARLQLSDGIAHWQDASLPGGAAQWTASRVQLQASDITWPLRHPLQLRASTQLAGAGMPDAAAHLAIQGQVAGAQAKLALSLRALPLALAQPYLAGWFKPLVNGTLDVDMGLAHDGAATVAHVASLSVDRLSLACPAQVPCRNLRRAGVADAAPAALQEVQRLELADATLWLQQRRVSLGRVALQQPRLQLERMAQGRFMFDDWWVPGAARSQAQADEGSWALRLDDLELSGASLAWRDAMAVRPVALNLQGFKASVQHLDWENGRMPAAALLLETRVAAGRAEPGRLRLEGSLALTPAPELKAKITAQRLPLHALEPYVAGQLNVDIVRADGSFSGEVQYQGQANGPRLALQGDAGLDDLRVLAGARQAADEQDAVEQEQRVGQRGEELLAGKSLRLNGVDVRLVPGEPLSLQVRETSLSDFFARIIVQEDGRFNLQDIRKAPTSPALPDGAAQVRAGAGSPAVPDPLAPVMHFGPVSLTNGSVRFTDHFIKPNYSADLSGLSGRLGAFSSETGAPGTPPQMAELELKGRAQTTATLEVSGRINPLAQPLALDIQAKMRDLELPPLSPYSVKYAGHGIERGKLSMDVSYQVQPDGKLVARNKLVLNQLAFGDKVEGAPASLPVRLAVALLADRNGVIDLDLPISGSLNDPQFSLGSVIAKIIGNLVMKAVTAPFSLLAGVFTGHDEQGVVDFAPGSATLGDQARAQLDKIARALDGKTALKVTVVGWADPEAEQQAYKRARLQEQVRAQKRKAMLQSGQPADAAAVVDAAEYSTLLKELYRSVDMKKPRNLIGMAKELPQSEMEALLLQHMQLPSDAMESLALARSTAVRDYLASRGVDMQRIFIAASKLHDAHGKAEGNWSPRAQMSLTMR